VTEEIYIDEFDLTPSDEELKAREEQAEIKEKEDQAKRELKPQIEVPGLGLPDSERTTGEVVKDILFGPKGVELAGPSKAPKLFRRIVERIEGVPEDELEPLV
jgi:hypothetical protein